MKIRGFIFTLMASSFSVAFVDQPAGCYAQQNFPCAIRATQNREIFDLKKTKLTVSKGSSILLQSVSEPRMLEGQFWFENAEKMIIYSGLADFEIEGDVWFEKNSSGRILALNLNGNIVAQKTSQPVPVGFQNWYDGMRAANEINCGIIQPINVRFFFAKWVRLTGSAKTAKSKIEIYKAGWQGNIQLASQFYQDIAKRRMASYEAIQDRRYEIYLKNQQENQQLRSLFRHRFYNP